MKQKAKVAFAHNIISHNTQGIMAGITEYIRDKGDWQLIIWADSSLESLEFLKHRGCQGAFVNIQTSTKAQQLLDLDMPIVAFNTLQNMLSLPYISADSRQVAQEAFDYFAGKKFRHFGFFGLTEARWSIERMEHFSRCVKQGNGTLHLYEGGQIPIKNESMPLAKVWIDMILHKGQQELINWLRNLPKPTAILASNDILACHLSSVAGEIGLSIPDEIAILGINDDQALCTLCDPPLSSIAFNLKKAGYDAAQLLDKIISGRQTMQGQWIRIRSAGVKERGSTEMYAIDDKDIIKALQFIRNNRSQPLQVEDIADHICISKRTLQMKFQKVLGASIHEEIIRAHVEVAKTLLIETNLSIEEIAVHSGFHYSSNMRRAFLGTVGMLPHKYRQTHRAH